MDYYKHKITTITSAEAKVITKMAYNKYNGLVTPMGNSNSLAATMSTVTYKEIEDPIYMTEYYYNMELYFKFNVYKNTGITLSEYLELPDHILEDILDFIVAEKNNVNRLTKELDERYNASLGEYEYELGE